MGNESNGDLTPFLMTPFLTQQMDRPLLIIRAHEG